MWTLITMSGMAYTLKFGVPLPGFRFSPGECIVNSTFAEDFRQGKVPAKTIRRSENGRIGSRN
jgi:hypothetical protein